MQRGEIWRVAFGPSVGGEPRKERPAAILSNDASNRHLNRVQVIPFTSNVERVYPGEVAVSFLGKPHKAVANQLTTVSKIRLTHRGGILSPSDLHRLEQAVLVQLGLVS